MAAKSASPPVTRRWPVLVRRARPDDRDAVLAFASRTWDGWDYIPNAWDHWIGAPDGVLLVATAGRAADGSAPRDAEDSEIPDDRPIAVARVSMLSEDEAWLEGIRVDPAMRGLGVATDLQVAELRLAGERGAKVVRYATGERNQASHRLGARHGFELLAAFRAWRWHERPPTDDEEEDEDSTSGFDDGARAEATALRQRVLADLEADGYVCSADEGDAWWARLTADANFLAARQLCEQRGWTMQELTRGLFEEHLERDEVLRVGRADDGPWALAVLHREALPSEDVDLHLGLLAGDGATALRLVNEIRGLADAPIRFWLPDPDPPLLRDQQAAFEAAGFHPRPWALHILARPIDEPTR